MVELRIAKKGDEEIWNQVLDVSPHSSPFHHWRWLKIMEKHTGFKLYPLIGFVGENPAGIFPVFFRKRFVRSAFSPPPHTAITYLGPVMVGQSDLRQSKKESINLEFQSLVDDFITSDLRANYVYLSLPPGMQDPRPFQWRNYDVKPAYGYIIDLNKGVEAVWKSVADKKLRENIRRAAKRGIYVEEGGKEELEVVYDLMAERYENQNKAMTVSKDYLLEIFDSFDLKVFVAKHGQDILTGSVCVCFKDNFLSWIGSPKPRVKVSPSPNDLLIWEEMRYACEHGFKYYEIMGTAGNKRLHKYYSKFNPELLVRFSAKKASFIPRMLEKVYSKLKR